MIGAIAGDMIGSIFEGFPQKSTKFPLFIKRSRFTDDTVLTCAIADYLLNGGDLINILKQYSRMYPNSGFGGNYYYWFMSDAREPYNSWGNGSAMRVSPVGFAFETYEEVLEWSKKTAEVTHNHPEGIKGAQATALAIFLARKGKKKDEIKDDIELRFGYNLSRTIDEIRPEYSFDVSCQGSVPESIIAFIESTSFEDAVRLAISLGGDTDTQGCITGGIAEAFYGGVPDMVKKEVMKRLPPLLKKITEEFGKKYCL